MIPLSDLDYPLPPERIAKYPLPQRDQSKLLVLADETIQHRQFFELPQLLPLGYSIFFNNTRVLPARLAFRKPTGAAVEVFLLSPKSPSPDPAQTLAAGSPSRWAALIGNARKVKIGTTLERILERPGQEAITLRMMRLDDTDEKNIELSWTPAECSLSEVLALVGEIPLPPYLGRAAESADADSYQTVYGRQSGAVAAPTAGLHFTEAVLEQLNRQGNPLSYLTLHVGAGTFRPVQTTNALDHPMHQERVVISEQNIQDFMAAKKILAVGTTSLRTLESMYWYGVQLLECGMDTPFALQKMDIYSESTQNLPDRKTIGEVLLQKMKQQRQQSLQGTTEIMIVPGYTFRAADALLTNFHQPQSTLILLIAAWIGPRWREVYAAALANDYRFLSYGDSSLLFRG